MGKPIDGVLRCDARQSRSNRLDQSRLGTRLGAAQGALDFAPHLLNGIEVRGVGRQKENLGPCLRNQGESGLTFVRGEVVHNDDIALAQGRREDPADIGPENLRIGGPLDGHAGGGTIEARIAQIMVVVCQWPWGLLAWTRCPRGARPRKRVSLVLAPDSSRKQFC